MRNNRRNFSVLQIGGSVAKQLVRITESRAVDGLLLDCHICMDESVVALVI